jgi:hypothetical protein
MGGAGATSSMSQWIEFPVADMSSWKSLFEERFNPDGEGRVLYDSAGDLDEARERSLTRWVRFFSFPFGGLFSAVRQLMGLEGAVYAMADQPKLIHAIVDDLSRFYSSVFARIVPSVRLDMVICFEDMCSNRAPLISPDAFDEFFAPGYRRYLGTLRELGVRQLFIDTDGDCRLILPQLIACGFTGVHPCEVKAGMNPILLLEEYPSLCCNGGIDKTAVARGGEALKDEVKARFDAAWRLGRYTPGLDHGFPPDISWPNAQEYGRQVLELSRTAPVA